MYTKFSFSLANDCHKSSDFCTICRHWKILSNFSCVIIANNSDDRKKRPRTAFSAAQIKALETEFERGKYLSVAKRTSLAKTLHLTETQVS